MKDFFVTYWKELAEAVILVLIFVIGLIGTKKKKSSPVLEVIYSQLPDIISRFEVVYGKGHGETKKDAVLDVCDGMFYKLTGFHLRQSEYYLRLVSDQIEKILCTPERKKNEK